MCVLEAFVFFVVGEQRKDGFAIRRTAEGKETPVVYDFVEEKT